MPDADAERSEPEKACPRCGGEFQSLRRSTRWGRSVVVLMCRDCQYLTQADILNPEPDSAPVEPR
jgi:RNA polymerase subunit RPABC4/transcription elongation factor Spt4